MLKKRGRPKKQKDVKKVNSPDVILKPDLKEQTTIEVVSSPDAVSGNCETPHCGSKAEAIINDMKYCKQCAQDHRL